MTPVHWAYMLVPPLPALPANLIAPLPLPVPVPVPRVRVRRYVAWVPALALADAAGQARLWLSEGGSLALIKARLNQACPQQPRWTRRAVRKLLLASLPMNTRPRQQDLPKAA